MNRWSNLFSVVALCAAPRLLHAQPAGTGSDGSVGGSAAGSGSDQGSTAGSDAGSGSGSGSADATPPPTTGGAQTEEPPTIVSEDPPIFPDVPKARQKPVDVEVHVEIDANGALTNARVISAANPPFDDLAIVAVSTWVFQPAKQDGKPTASHLNVTVHFDPKASGGETIAIKATIRKVEPPKERGASTIDIVPSQLSKTAQATAGKMLEQAPGLFLANEGGAGHADQVFLRGFDAEQGQDIEFTVGGVPINEVDNTDGHGYADTHFIIPEVVQNLRVVEGPFDPHQGDFAVAGSAAYELGVKDRGLRFDQTYGSFGTSRSLALWAPEAERDATFGAVSIESSNGYGINRAATDASAMGQYEGTFGEHGIWRMLATAYGTHYKSAGVVRADDVNDGKVDFYGTEDPSQGGDAQRFSLAFSVENPLEDGTMKQQIFTTYRTLHIIEDFTGFLLDNPEPGQSFHPQRGDAIEQDYSAITVGARGSYEKKAKLFGQDQSIELGYYARYDHTDPGIDRLRFGTDIPYLIDETLTTDVVNLAPYIDVDFRPTSWLTFRGGGRQEFFSYNVLNNCATDGEYLPKQPLNVLCPAYDSAGERQPTSRISATGTITEPKVTAIAQLPAGVEVTASAGVGAQSLDATQLGNNENAPFATLHAGEAGAIYHGNWSHDAAEDQWKDLDVSARAVAYYTHVDRDLIFDPLQGRLSASTGTTRRGFALSGHASGRWFNELASFTYAYATYDQDGTLVPYVPSTVARSDTSIVHAIPNADIDGKPVIAGAGVGLNFIGQRALPLGQFSQSTFTIDASASARWRWVKLSIEAFNLANSKYPLTEYFYASDFHNGPPYPTLAPSLNFTAAPPRTLMFTASLLLGEGGK